MSKKFKTHTCALCGLAIDVKTCGLHWHLKNSHNIEEKDYYDQNLKAADEGLCSVCHQPTQFIKVTEGYEDKCDACRKYVKTTICRVCNQDVRQHPVILTKHFSAHGLTVQGYYDKFLRKPNEGFCETCSVPTRFWNFSHGYRRFCSKSCSGKDPVHHAEAVRRLQKWIGSEANREQIRALGIRPENSRLQRARLKKMWANPEYVRRHKERMIKQHAENTQYQEIMKYAGRGKKGYFFSEMNQRKIFYRSSYELQAYQILEQMKTAVASYEAVPFHIAYVKADGLVHNYFPDILVTYKDGSRELIEIKPNWCKGSDENQRKFKVARRYCHQRNIKFTVWTEAQLSRVG